MKQNKTYVMDAWQIISSLNFFYYRYASSFGDIGFVDVQFVATFILFQCLIRTMTRILNTQRYVTHTLLHSKRL